MDSQNVNQSGWGTLWTLAPPCLGLTQSSHVTQPNWMTALKRPNSGQSDCIIWLPQVQSECGAFAVSANLSHIWLVRLNRSPRKSILCVDRGWGGGWGDLTDHNLFYKRILFFLSTYMQRKYHTFIFRYYLSKERSIIIHQFMLTLCKNAIWFQPISHVIILKMWYYSFKMVAN